MTRKRQYISQGLFGLFYIKQYPGLKYNQFSFHVTIKLSKKAVMRHIIKRAVIQRIQEQNLDKKSINGTFYKFFVVVSKNRVDEIVKKIANLPKKDTIKYIQEEFEKSWKLFNYSLYTQKSK